MHGLYLLWWVGEKEMSPAVVATILALGDFALMAIELPTGWFADRVGHRASLVLGSALQVLGMLWCWLGEGLAGLIVASVLVAAGDAFRSGAGEALLYRSCAALGDEHRFQQVQARTSAVETAALAGLVLVGGAIVTAWGFRAGWIAECLLCTAGLAMACAMTEPPAVPSVDARDADPASLRLVTARLAALIVPAALLGGLASAASFLAQTNGTADTVSVTILVAALAVAETAGAAAAARLRAGGVWQQSALGAAGGALFLACLAVPSASMLAVPALACLAGLAHPLRATVIQRASRDDTRARVASLASACDMAVSILLLPLAGLWRGRRSRRT